MASPSGGWITLKFYGIARLGMLARDGIVQMKKEK